MSRVVVIVLAVLVFFWLLRRALGSRRRDENSTRDENSSDGVAGRGRGKPVVSPDLVACARCGVLVPKDEALIDGQDAQNEAQKVVIASGKGIFFCSEEHRRLGPL